MRQYFLVIIFLFGLGFHVLAQEEDSTKKTKWEFAFGFGLIAPNSTRNIARYPYENFALYPKQLDINVGQYNFPQINNTPYYGEIPLAREIQASINYRLNNSINIGSSSMYWYNNSSHSGSSYRRFNQQIDLKINLIGKYEGQLNLIFFGQGSVFSLTEYRIFRGNATNKQENRIASEGHKYKYFSHTLGFGIEWVEYLKNSWGYGISLKVGNDMHYRRSIEKVELSLDGYDLLPLLNKNQTSFIFKHEIPANTSLNEPTYAARDFLPHAFAQLTFRFIYLR